jgi:hypothetical protein
MAVASQVDGGPGKGPRFLSCVPTVTWQFP